MLQRSLWVRMPQVALHVFDSGVTLDVRRRRPAECLEREIVNVGFLCQRFQVPLQIIADAERAAISVWKQERARVAAIRMLSNPSCKLSSEIRRDGYIIVAFIRLCFPDSILS